MMTSALELYSPNSNLRLLALPDDVFFTILTFYSDNLRNILDLCYINKTLNVIIQSVLLHTICNVKDLISSDQELGANRFWRGYLQSFKFNGIINNDTIVDSLIEHLKFTMLNTTNLVQLNQILIEVITFKYNIPGRFINKTLRSRPEIDADSLFDEVIPVLVWNKFTDPMIQEFFIHFNGRASDRKQLLGVFLQLPFRSDKSSSHLSSIYHRSLYYFKAHNMLVKFSDTFRSDIQMLRFHRSSLIKRSEFILEVKDYLTVLLLVSPFMISMYLFEANMMLCMLIGVLSFIITFTFYPHWIFVVNIFDAIYLYLNPLPFTSK